MLLLHEPAARGTLRSPPSPRPFLSTSTLPGFLSIHPSCPYPFPSQLQPSNQPPIIPCTVWYCNPSSGSSIMSDRSCDNFKDKTPQDYALLCYAKLRSGLVDSNPTAQCKRPIGSFQRDDKHLQASVAIRDNPAPDLVYSGSGSGWHRQMSPPRLPLEARPVH